MQLRFDLSVGALYVRLGDQRVARTREIDDNTNVDLDAAGRVVGIEVVSVHHPWPLDQILGKYAVAAADAAQLRAYFSPATMRAAPPQASADPIAAKDLVAA
jgi:uncharacterized protein YuzE